MSNRKTQTVEDVKLTLSKIKKVDARDAMARAMLKHGNLTDEAVKFVIEYVDHAWQCKAYGIKR